MNADTIIAEIKNVSTYLGTQGPSMAPDQLALTSTSMVRSVLCMINGIKYLPAVTASSLMITIDAAGFTDLDKDNLKAAVNTKLLTGCEHSASKLPAQRFADPSDSQNLFTKDDWSVFCDATASRSHKIETLVATCHRVGIDNPDQASKCDLATVLSWAHYHGEAAPRVLYDLGNDVKAMFDKTPSPFIGAVTRFTVVPAVHDLPADVKKHAWGEDAPVRDTITNWNFLRSKIASRSNSKLMREETGSPSTLCIPQKKGSPKGCSTFDPQLMFQMGMMMSAMQGNPQLANHMAAMLGNSGGGGGAPDSSGATGSSIPGLQIFGAGAGSRGEGLPAKDSPDGRRADSQSRASSPTNSDATTLALPGTLTLPPYQSWVGARSQEDMVEASAPAPGTVASAPAPLTVAAAPAPGQVPKHVGPIVELPPGHAPTPTPSSAPAVAPAIATVPAAPGTCAPAGAPLKKTRLSDKTAAAETAADKVATMMKSHQTALETALNRKQKKPKKAAAADIRGHLMLQGGRGRRGVPTIKIRGAIHLNIFLNHISLKTNTF